MLDDRIDPAALPMAVGDFAVLAVVFATGTVRHHGLGVLTTDPVYVLSTIAPFLLGWAVAAPLLGAYASSAIGSYRARVSSALGAWVIADAIALALRATPYLHGGVAPSFVLVTLAFGAVGLVLWRVLYGFGWRTVSAVGRRAN